MDFVAIDFETANPNYASVCAAGWATVRGGQIVDHGSWLCRPPAGHTAFGAWNIKVHGITADKVAGQPTFSERIPDLLARLDGLPVLAHNAKFDVSVLGQALAACGRTYRVADHHCTMEWSKMLLTLPKYNLPAVCKELNITLDQHHEAGSDALSAAEVALRLADRVGAATVTELDEKARANSPYGR
ncbi:exonuclease domain-containing protein [Mycobacteroides abscessus]|uniref:exonuclease domain-containing protein n=1 Tax=Mycobacteroides abscessus TaxID=36809 RepID=UPI0009A7180C|nr:exonuclease domain-containing protein [Mycobacteroides abscessus]MBN7314148.1 DNA polymerase III subunit epsilon [Mycobacteroides abscessus subsp. abscessus]SKG10099.1 DNA polymerase III, epsilon subunit (DnaQ) [Mycobacteroides abscessus subsp. massiliense]